MEHRWISALTSGMASVGLDQDTINHYVAFQRYCKDVVECSRDLLTNVLHLSSKTRCRQSNVSHPLNQHERVCTARKHRQCTQWHARSHVGKFAKDTHSPRLREHLFKLLVRPQHQCTCATTRSYAIGEKLDCIGPTNCTDTARYTDEYGCEVSYQEIQHPSLHQDHLLTTVRHGVPIACLANTLNLTRLCQSHGHVQVLAFLTWHMFKVHVIVSVTDFDERHILTVCSAYGIDANDLEVWNWHRCLPVSTTTSLSTT